MHGGELAPCGHFWLPCEHGSRGCACASERWVERCASYECLYINAVIKGGGIIGTPCVTGNSWGCKKSKWLHNYNFFGLVAAYWDRLRCSLFTSLYDANGCVLPQRIHKLLKSYPQKNRKTACIFIFYKNPKKISKPLIFNNFIFVELEINVWITIHPCRAVADY